ncbi:MAG: undecaprenyl-phosphate glucose phosphotransferase [Suipraeoptans sp.]
MIKDNQNFLSKIHILVDAIIIVFSYLAAWLIRFQSDLFTRDPWQLSFYQYTRVLIFVVPCYLLLYYIFQLYTPKRVQGRRLEAWHIIQANVIGLMAFILVLYFARQQDYSRSMIFVFFCVNIYMEIVVRNVIRQSLRNIRKKGYNQKHILLIGYSRAAEEYINRILSNPEWGYKIRGILDDDVASGTEYKGVKVIGTIDNLNVVLPANRLDEIAITMGLSGYGRLEEIVTMCEKSGVHTKFIPDYNNIIPTKPYTEDLQGLPVINIRRVPLTNTLSKWMKRTEDIVGASVALILFSPILLTAMILIKTTSKGPLIYKQERIGLHNKPFNMYKFRSMEVQKKEDEEKMWTVEDDPRVTWIGKIIRRTSIDEFPQMINVLKGDMSLIGPRPERPQFVERFKEEIPRYMIKHQVRPGLTGWAQVNGLRGDTSIYKRIEYDLYYIENWTIGFDFKIIFLTFFKGFINRNAY